MSTRESSRREPDDGGLSRGEATGGIAKALAPSATEACAPIPGHPAKLTETFTKVLLESAPIPVFWKDREGRYLGCNRAFEELMACRANDIVGRKPHECWPAIHADEFCRMDLEILATPHDQRYSTSLLNRRGQVLDVVFHKHVFHDESGGVAGLVGAIVDIPAIRSAEAALAKERALLRCLIDSIPEIIFFKDTEGRYLGANPAFELYAGRREKEVIGLTDLDFLPREEAKSYRRMDRQMLDSGESRRTEEWITYPDGRKALVETLKTPFGEPGGKVLGLVGVSRDITHRKAAENEIASARRNFETFFNTIDDFLFVLDDAGRVLHVNETVTRRLGFTEDELRGMSVLMVHPPDRREEAGRIVGAMLAGSSDYCPVPLQARDGTLIPVEMRVTRGEWNGSPALFGVSKDVTELKRSEEKFARAFHAGAVLMAISTVRDGRFVDVNSCFLKTLGYTREDVVGRTSAELGLLRNADDRTKVHSMVEALGFARDVEVDVLTRSGQVRHGLFSADPVDVGGQPCLLTVMTDITDRERARRDLATSEQRYRGLIESQRMLIVRVDPGGGFTFANDAFCRTFGLKREELSSATYQPMIHPEDLPATLEIMKGLYRPPWRVHIENRVRTTDGWRWMAWENDAIRDATGRVVEVQSIGRDITAARIMQDALQSRLKFRSLLNSLSRDLINPPASMDLGIQKSLEGIGRFTGADRAYIFLYQADPAVMDNTHEWCAEGIEPQIENLQNLPCSIFAWCVQRLAMGETIRAARVADLPEEARAEREVLQAQGIQSVLLAPLTHRMDAVGFIGLDAVRRETNWTEDNVELLRLAGDMIVNAIQQKKTQDGLRIAKEQAEAAKHAQMMFLANMSHEIRTPLNAILGYAQILQQDPAHQDGDGRPIQTIMRSADHLLTLINDILALSRCEAGELSLTPTPFDLHALLNSMLDMFRPKASGLALTLSFPPAVPRWMIADGPKVRQVVLNLLGNAVKFTETGSICVTAGFETGAPPAGAAAEPLVFVEVADTGCGIAAEELPMIFDEFKQAAAGQRKRTGTGLGLALSRRYARLLGGDVTARSTLNAGSVFHFTFRAAPTKTPHDAAPGIAEGAVRLAGTAPPPRLLVVDDDEPSRIMLHAMLSGSGFSVCAVDGGEEACRVAASWHPAAVLMDRRMPGMDGIEAMRRIKTEAGASPIPVIIVTASGFGDAHVGAIKEGADGFVAKPVRAERLFGELRRILKVDFVARETPPEPEAPVATPADVSDLPSGVRAAMRTAIRRGDIAELRRQIDGILPTLPRTARVLRVLANRFAYDKFESLLAEPEDPAP